MGRFYDINERVDKTVADIFLLNDVLLSFLYGLASDVNNGHHF